MLFANLPMLLGLLAVSVPIIIHLLNKRKHKRVVWAAMRFLELALKRNKKRMNIEDLILLILRCALLALIALAMARPALQGAGMLIRQQASAVLIIDNSYSMAQTDGVQSRFELAKTKVADQILSSLPGGSSAALLLASNTVEEVIPDLTTDLNLVRQRARLANICDRGTDLMPALQRAMKILDGKMGARQIYILTDGQAAGWRQANEIQRLLESTKADIGTSVIIVGENEKANVGVSSIQLANMLAPVNQPLRVEVGVKNYGREEASDLPVRLSMDGEPPSEEATIPSLRPGESKSVGLYAKFRDVGLHTITAQIPKDRLPRDDQRSLVVQAIRQVQVLLVDGHPSDNMRDSETFYLRFALQPVAAALREDYFIQTKAITPGELDNIRLDEYDVLVLANVPDLSQTAIKNLERAVRDGRGLIVVPGEQSNSKFYNDALARPGMLPASLGAPEGEASQDEKFWTFQKKDFTHPIATLWNDPAVGNIASPRFYRRYELKPVPTQVKTDANAPDRGPVSVIMQFNDGKPAILECAYGAGRIVLFTGPLSTNGGWNDLAVRPKVFIPLLYRTLGLLLSRPDQRLTLQVGQKLAWRAGEDLHGKDMMITRPGEEKLRDTARITMQSGYPTLQYDRTNLSGIYNVMVNGETAPVVKFAVQSDPSESQLEPLTEDQVKTLNTVAKVTTWKPGTTLASEATASGGRAEFWYPIAVIAALMVLAETVLAYRFSQSK